MDVALLHLVPNALMAKAALKMNVAVLLPGMSLLPVSDSFDCQCESA